MKPTFPLKYLFSILFITVSLQANAQLSDDLVQFTGVIVTGDSLQSVPYTIVMVKGTSRGTFSDYFGYFSFVARKRDTIEFSCIGYRKALFIIPDTLTENRYSIIQILDPDTFQLPVANVFPWPSKEEFKSAFIELNAPDDYLSRAARNLDPAALSQIAEREPQDAEISFKNQMQYQQTKLYTSGQYIGNQLLNPIAWAKFIQAWKQGAFKKKKNEPYNYKK